MNSPTAYRFASRFLKSASIVVLAGSLVSVAHGAPSLAGPSMVPASQAVVLNGSGFAANSAVSISVKSPSGTEAHYSAVIGPDGRISYTVQPYAPGTYTVKVLSSGGAPLSETRFHVMQ